MTSISSALTSSQYQYRSTVTAASVMDVDDSSDSSSSSAKKSTSTTAVDTSSTEDQSLIAAAEKFMSQMMMMMLDNQSDSSTSNGSGSSTDSGSVTSTASSTDQTNSQTNPVSAMDTNGDGSVSEAEFVAARPSDVSEDQASSLFESFDSDNTGSLTDDQLSQAMQANRPPPPQGTQAQANGGVLSDIFDAMDTDGDGQVSEAEFVAAKPAGASDDQASSLFESLDATQSGSLTESQFATGVKTQVSSALQQQLPDLSSLFSSGFSDDTSEDLLSL